MEIRERRLGVIGKLFRTTAFKLSLAYLLLFSIGAGLVLTRVGARVKEVLDEQLNRLSKGKSGHYPNNMLREG